MQELLINCYSKSEKLSVVAFLYALGYKWSNQDTFQGYVSSHGCTYDTWPNVLLRRRDYKDDYYIDSCSGGWSGAKSIEFSQLEEVPGWIQEEEQNKPVTIKISKDYDAIVSKKKGIQVGCQTITFEDFDKLAEIVAKVRN